MARGMLDEIMGYKPRDLRQEELDEDKRINDLASGGAFKALASTVYSSARDAGRALGETAAYAFGKDPRTPAKRHTDAVEAAKAQVAQLGLDPDDPKSMDQFYRQVIMILQKQGLAAEALAVGKEYQAQKRATAKGDLEVQELQRKKDRDLATNARAVERNAILAKRGLATPETLQLLAELDNTPVEQAEKRKAITARLNALAAAGNKGVDFVDLGGKVQIVDKATGKEIRNEDKSADPTKPASAAATAKEKAATEATKKAYVGAKAGFQSQYDAVVELHNSPGLDSITGWWGSKIGAVGSERGALSEFATATSNDAAKNAVAKYDQVVGGAFLSGLAILKDASKTGSTGLGQVTEIEGKKVQDATAALGRLQAGSSIRSELVAYAGRLKEAADRIDASAADHGVTIVPLQTKEFVVPTKGRGRQRPAPAATPAPAAPAGGWTPEKERRYQELLRKQNAS